MAQQNVNPALYGQIEHLTASLYVPYNHPTSEMPPITTMLIKPVDMSRSFVEVWSAPSGDRQEQAEFSVEAELQYDRVVWRYNLSRYNTTGYPLYYDVYATVYQLKRKPRSLQVITSVGLSVNLPIPVNPARTIFARSCAAGDAFGFYGDAEYHAYLIDSQTVRMNYPAAHARAAVIEI